MTLKATILMAMWVFVTVPSMAAEADNVEVFHTNQNRLVNVPKDAVLYNVDVFIDMQNNLKQAFADSIDARMDDEEKQAIAHALTKKMGFKRRSTNKAMTRSWLGLYKMHRYDLAYLPAVVFNETAVIYGEENIEKALAIYQTKRNSQ